MTIASLSSVQKKTIRSFIRKLLFLRLRIDFSVGAVLAPRATAARAARLVCTPQRPRPDQLELSPGLPQPVIAVRPFASGALRVYTWGDPARQPTVALVHGWNGWAFQFAALVPILLARGMAVVAIDHVAHGGSAGRLASLPTFIRSLRDVLAAYPRVSHIVAHSLGAAATTCVLAESGARPRTVLLAPPRHPRTFVDQFAAAFGMSAHVADMMQHWMEQQFGISFDEVDGERLAPHVRAPTLLIHDRADKVVPFAHGERYAARIPGARMLALQGVGHTQMLRAPDVLEQVADFLFEAPAVESVRQRALAEA